MQTFTAELHETDPVINIDVPEDFDITLDNGWLVPTAVYVEESEEWEPESYTAALADEGWEVIGEWNRTGREATVRWVGAEAAR